jgi:hypothetical protein
MGNILVSSSCAFSNLPFFMTSKVVDNALNSNDLIWSGVEQCKNSTSEQHSNTHQLQAAAWLRSFEWQLQKSNTAAFLTSSALRAK